MAEDKSPTVENPISYIDKLGRINCIHKNIQEKLVTLIRILKMRITPKTQTLKNLSRLQVQIDDELSDEEFGIVYSNMDVLSIHLPNLRNEQKNWNTLQQEEVVLLADYIDEIVAEANNIKKEIVKVPIEQKESLMDMQEKNAFEQTQKMALNALKGLKRKGDFDFSKRIILDRCNTEEKKILINNLCFEMYGQKLEEMEWKIGMKGKKASAKSVEQQ